MNNRLREVGSVLVGVGAMAIVLMFAWVLVSIYGLTDAIRETQQTGSPILKAIADQQDDIEEAATAAKSTNDQLLDCLQPSGDCYKDSQKRTSDVVGSINEITYYAVSCADAPGTQSLEEIQACVIQRLGRSHRG